MEKELIAIIREASTTKGFATDFYFRDGKAILNVNDKLYKIIQAHNKKARAEGNTYSTIPYSQDEDGCLTYSFGCGTTHYLIQPIFEGLVEASPILKQDLPLHEIERSISVYLPHELDLAQEEYNYLFKA